MARTPLNLKKYKDTHGTGERTTYRIPQKATQRARLHEPYCRPSGAPQAVAFAPPSAVPPAGRQRDASPESAVWRRVKDHCRDAWDSRTRGSRHLLGPHPWPAAPPSCGVKI